MYLSDINSLRSLTTLSSDPQYEVAGYDTPGDEGGGTFVYVPLQIGQTMPSDDGGIVIVSLINSGYFKRLYSGTINVKWFGAKGQGDTGDDDWQAIQNALDYYRNETSIPDEGCEAVYIPKGVYYVGQGLTYFSAYGAGNTNGLKLLGDGQEATIIKPLSTFTSGNLFEIDGTGGGYTPTFYQFQLGGYIRDIGFDAFMYSNTLVCLKLVAWWLFKIEMCKIQGFGSHGIYLPIIGTGNPDGYTVVGEYWGVKIVFNGGWGWNGESGIGCSGSMIRACYINGNASGGIWMAGTQMSIIDSAIASNGIPNTNSGDGICFKGGHNCYVARNEIDTNYGLQINIDNLYNSIFEANRINYNDLAGVTPINTFIQLSQTPTGVAVSNITIKESAFRIGKSGTYTGIKFDHEYNIVNVNIHDNNFDITVPSITLNKYDFSPTNAWTSNYKIDERDGTTGEFDYVSIGKPRPNDIKASGFVGVLSVINFEGFNIKSVTILGVGQYRIDYNFPLFNHIPSVVATPCLPLWWDHPIYAKAQITHSDNTYMTVALTDSHDNFIDVDFMFHAV